MGQVDLDVEFTLEKRHVRMGKNFANEASVSVITYAAE